MTAHDARLGRAYLELTARERALFVCRALREGSAPDTLIVATMPNLQQAEFDRLLTLYKGLLRIVGARSLMLYADVDALKVRRRMLAAFSAWAEDRANLVGILYRVASQPIRDSEHERLLADARSEYI